MIQTLIHHPADGLITLLFLVVLVFIIDRLGLLTWIAWLNRGKGKPKDKAAKEYWRVHL
jgi:hypothetical protein